MLDRLSWIVLQTRPLALMYFQEALQRNRDWKPKYRSGPKVAVAPSLPYKFLDIGTRMGSYRLGEHIPKRDDTDNIFHPAILVEEFLLLTHSMLLSLIEQQNGLMMWTSGVLRRHGSSIQSTLTSGSRILPDTFVDCR